MSDELEIEHASERESTSSASISSSSTNATEDLHKRLTRQYSSGAQLIQYDDVVERFDDTTQTTVKKNFTSALLEDVAQYAQGFHPVTVVADNLTYVVQTEPVHEGVPTVGKTIKNALNLRKRFQERGRPKVDTTILHDVSFVLKPGESMLVLGPPRSGKSTLLQLLANRRRHGTVSGGVYMDAVPLYGAQQPRNWHRQVVYVSQHDEHLARLTVRETFEFAFECVGPETVPAWKREEDIDQVLDMLGLHHQATTLVGGELLRGVSGGERKRVTIGVEFGRFPELVLLDEVTTGLDATTSLGVISRVNLAAKVLNLPVICSLQQPSYELFSQFDKLLLMEKGRVAYFGPISSALPFFETLGFRCPEHENPADFLPTVLNNPALYFRPVEGASPDSKPSTARQICQAYRRSEHYRQVEQEVNELLPDENNDATATADSDSDSSRLIRHPLKGSRRRDALRASHTLQQHKYPLSLGRQTFLLLKRGFLQHKNDTSVIATRFISAIIMSLVLGTFFFQLGDSQADTVNKGGLTFFMITFICLNAMGTTMPLVFQERPVFIAQREAKYYSTFPYWMGAILVELPVGFLESSLFGTIVYWMAGMNPDVGRFFFFLLVLFAASQSMGAFTRFCAVMSRELEVAESMAGAGVGLFMIFSGFMIHPDRLWPPLLAFIYTSPMFYASQAVMINELSGRVVNCTQSELVPPTGFPTLDLPYEQGGFNGTQVCPLPTGEAILAAADVDTEAYWKWIWTSILFVMVILFQVLSYFGLKFVHHDPSGSRNPIEQRSLQNDSLIESVIVLPSVAAARDSASVSASTSFSSVSGMAIEMRDLRVDDGEPTLSLARGAEFGVGINSSAALPGSLMDLSAGSYLSFQNLCYAVTLKKGKRRKKYRKPLLHNVSGYCTPGMLLALMGPSGAGKSTLLDVLAERKTGGKTKGTILFNGGPRNANYRRESAYVEQNDTHLPTQTVREAIEFSARTRTTLSKQERIAIVDQTLEILDLVSIEGLMIGGGSLGTILSPEQKKRVTIAVELATQPKLLFLDEPTSGLDTVGAFNVMRLVKRIANRGVSIVCTIHQPSASVFALFTHLLLLRRGGYPLYFGELGESHSTLFAYFKSLGHRCPQHKNPADFILDISMSVAAGDHAESNLESDDEAEAEAHAARQQQEMDAQLSMASTSGSMLPTLMSSADPDVDPAEVVLGDHLIEHWQHCDERTKQIDLIEKGICPANVAEDASAARLSRYQLSYVSQFVILCKRASRGYWRRPSIVLSKVFINAFMSILLGVTFWDLPADQLGAAERSSLFFFLCLFGVMNAFAILALVHDERGPYYRERASYCYSSITYILSFILSELPYQLLSIVMIVIPVYFMAGLQLSAAHFFKFALVYLLSSLASTALCQASATITTSLAMATAVVSAILTIFAITAGYILSKADMPKPYLGVYYANYVSYSLEAFLSNEFSGLELSCPDNEGAVPVPVMDSMGVMQTQYFCPMTSGEIYLDSLGLNADNFWLNVMAVALFAVAFELLSWVGAKFVVAIKR
mmetsp:Transcript_10461/g.26329  ORF Transcript_10461/g.26329 Transcript_10461/m.26329 type:complete len:1533 (+) Transcript_10461:208-4806(+)|eukprot:CAMPEP_0174246060 /NCGR_PEP_ID=MMETSP0417-20130205/41878_1 /TAXON_ID=242541 /ORGANISM="Mayorella sp, Strain BSH-02190019" /LENGTH=1532 /DNA_ID=CAMNT_0015325911 /DNA_START=107 /DNA_END=4705 /DNA_ORIENTATION=-